MQDTNVLMVDLSSADQGKLRYLEITTDIANNEYIRYYALLFYWFYDVFNIITSISQENCCDARYKRYLV